MRYAAKISVVIISLLGVGLFAAEKRAEPNLEQRISDLEAYVNNTARIADTTNAVSSNLGVYDQKDGNYSSSPGPGHNAWLMISTALVLFMTLPGLALFYGGLVRKKNVLSVLAQCIGIAGLVTILWWIYGYSFVFADGAGPIFGNVTKHLFFKGVDSFVNTNYCYWVSHNIFAMFQMMFAIITPALIVGAVAERIKFSALLLFIGLWMVIVYFPLAHMVWGINGLMNGVWNPDAKIRAMDFAGGTVVHMSSGWSALIFCLILGKRLGYPKEPMPPHSMVLCLIGTGMLWVGWYGFNAGSALAADTIAANAFVTTTLATAIASFVWAMLEWTIKGKPSVLGFCSGAVAGLVVVTPACGFISTNGAVIVGLAAGSIPFFAVSYLKPKLGFDDALDTFGIHGVGGTLGALLTGLLATGSVNPNLTEANAAAKANGLAYIMANGGLVFEQLKAIILTLILSIVGTLIVALLLKLSIGLRPSEEVETVGLDLSEHGEEAYHH
ncbi:MAG: ammonium transporter [Verrucomicrobiia bacterium]